MRGTAKQGERVPDDTGNAASYCLCYGAGAVEQK